MTVLWSKVCHAISDALWCCGGCNCRCCGSWWQKPANPPTTWLGAACTVLTCSKFGCCASRRRTIFGPLLPSIWAASSTFTPRARRCWTSADYPTGFFHATGFPEITSRRFHGHIVCRELALILLQPWGARHGVPDLRSVVADVGIGKCDRSTCPYTGFVMSASHRACPPSPR